MGFHEQLKSKIINKNNYNGIKEGQKVVMGGGGGGGGPAAAVGDMGEGGVLKETNRQGPQHAIDITEQLPAPHADADISMADGATPALSNIAKIKKTDTVIIGTFCPNFFNSWGPISFQRNRTPVRLPNSSIKFCRFISDNLWILY